MGDGTGFHARGALFRGPVLLCLLLCLAAGRAAAADFSEPPRALAEGIAPTALIAGGSPLLFWQESGTRDGRGQAWIVRSRLVDGQWSTARIAGPTEYRGTEPILYSAAVSPSGVVALALAISGTAIEIRLSRDGGASFQLAATVTTERPTVGARVFPSASGGWLLFATQPQPESAPAAQDATPSPAENTNSIVVAASADGATWTAPSPLVADAEGLVNNYLPAAAALGRRDFVVFQNQVLRDETATTHYVLYSKYSDDGGRTWSKALPITDYQEPAAGALAGTATGEAAGPRNYDNQAPRLVENGGRLHLAWQRRFTKGTQVRIATAVLDGEGHADPKSIFYLSSPTGSYILADFLSDEGQGGARLTALYLEDRLASNETLRRRLVDGNWSAPEALSLTALADPTRSGATSFARALTLGGRLYALWQYDDQVGPRLAPVPRQRVFLLEPVLHVDPPSVAVANYRPGGRSRDETVSVGIVMPRATAGIARLAYTWRRVGDEPLAAAPGPLPPKDEIWSGGTLVQGAPDQLRLAAPSDGAWVLRLSVEDRAGNRSVPASLAWFRDRTPPSPPVFITPALDAKGFLASNTIDLEWLPPPEKDLAGYTWAGVGPLDPLAVPAALRRGAGSKVPGLSAIETAVVAFFGLPKPPPAILGTGTNRRLDNIDDGYWLWSVAAVDTTGNISDTTTILLRADKQVPFTLVRGVRQATDLIGRRSLAVDGRGFLDQGAMAELILSRDKAGPYDYLRRVVDGGFRIVSNRLIDSVEVEDLPPGSYWLGLRHPRRGLYWAPTRVVVEVSGTIKYGLDYAYNPSWNLVGTPSTRFGFYDAIIAAGLLFCALGILFSTGQVVSAWRDGAAVRLQVLALVNGGPMPSAERKRAAERVRRKGLGLMVKFTFFIGTLVLFVVLAVALSLGLSMVRNQSQALARGLQDSANVLLESAAQGGRFFLDKEGAVTQLGFLPAQAKAMPGADFITITGNSADPKAAGRDVVYATNDPDIAKKIDSSRLELGVSPMKAGVEPLASSIDALAKDLEAKAGEAIAGDLARKTELQNQKNALPKGGAGDEERRRINADLDAVDADIRVKLREISDGSVGSVPPFDPSALGTQVATYLFHKPILEYRPGDQTLFRGMVRLQANTALIAADVRARTIVLVGNTAVIAALVLLVGVIGAFLLSRNIVRPIGFVINAIEKMRRTEDKADLAGFKVEVGTRRDELFTLASAANELARELVDAAKQSKAIEEGSDIQNLLIPLDDAVEKKKFAYGSLDRPQFDMCGYYKGAKKVSGDYWDFREIAATGRYYYFIKCDVSGKDVAAAFIMVQVVSLVVNHFMNWESTGAHPVREPVKSKPAYGLVELTYRVNDFLADRGYGGKFAAYTLGVYDAEDGTITYTHAGDNVQHFWREATRRHETEKLAMSTATGMFHSSMFPPSQPYRPYVNKLLPGDMLILYTDGIEEDQHLFRDAEFRQVKCTEVPDKAEHGHHVGGQGFEEFTLERVHDFIQAVKERGSYRLVREHPSPDNEFLSFDFRGLKGTTAEFVVALIAANKAFRLYLDPSTPTDEFVLVDLRVLDFLLETLDQRDLFFGPPRSAAEDAALRAAKEKRESEANERARKDWERTRAREDRASRKSLRGAAKSGGSPEGVAEADRPSRQDEFRPPAPDEEDWVDPKGRPLPSRVRRVQIVSAIKGSLINDPNYARVYGIREDPQFDDLTLLCIRRK